MSLPGLLIEYLITGTTAFLWLWFLLHHNQAVVPADLRLDKVDVAKVTLLAPFAYVLGMIVDFVSLRVTDGLVRHLLWPLRHRIAKALPNGWQNLKVAVEPRKRSKATLSQQEVMLVSADLGKQLEMRSSRDRVARGAFLNSVLGTLALSFHYAAQPHTDVSATSILFGGFVLTSVLFAMWLRFDRLTPQVSTKGGRGHLEEVAEGQRHEGSTRDTIWTSPAAAERRTVVMSDAALMIHNGERIPRHMVIPIPSEGFAISSLGLAGKVRLLRYSA